MFVTEIGEATAPAVPTEGKPAFNADGGIYIIKNADAKLSQGGSYAADAFIYGSNTMLGNPVDISTANVNGYTIMIAAEKANKKLIVFRVNDNGNAVPYKFTGTSFQPEAIDIAY